MDESDAQKMAMFRFGLIAPVINETYTEPSKLAYFRTVTSGALTLPDGAKRSYSPSTLTYWERLYLKGGFNALVHTGRSDKGYSRKLTGEAAEAIFALRKAWPKINATMIFERLIEEGVINAHDVSLSTVQRFVRARARELCAVPESKDRKAFEAERVLGLWQADTLYGPFVTEDAKKQRAYLICVIDDKSRLIVGGRFFLADSALNFQKVLKDAVLRFGLPEKLYVDNGAPYRNDQLSAICGALGCVLIHAPVRDGAAKGKIERANRTIRTRFLSVLEDSATSSIDALNNAFIKWINAYNTQTHSATGKAPMESYRAEQGRLRIPESAQWVADAFMNRITRKVKGDSTIAIGHVSYDVPLSFIAQTVEVRFLPDDMAGAYIVCEGVAYPIHPTDKAANSKARRATSRYLVDYTGKGGDTDVSPTLSAHA
jgi:transposase InsO family protein